MTDFLLNFCKIKWFNLRLFLQLILTTIKIAKKITGTSLVMDYERFLNANSLKHNFEKDISNLYDLELIIVACEKDFDVINQTLHLTLRSLSNFNSIKVKMIVPSQDILKIKRLKLALSHEIQIIDERSIVNGRVFLEIKNLFKDRDTWVYQQLLKLYSVAQSTAQVVMVLDADTVLVQKLKWIISGGRQLLMPSHEYNKPYYSFLEAIKINQANPKFTFVSHHMIYFPTILRQILTNLKVDDQLQLIKLFSLHAALDSFSPVCVDYELYGQWMSSNLKMKVYYGKWANLGISRTKLEKTLNSPLQMKLYSKCFNSISFHSWS